MKRYEGKNVVIIGGTSGMGLATAKTTACWQTRIRLTGLRQKKWTALAVVDGGLTSAVSRKYLRSDEYSKRG
jgi:NAD(P)-dependent dehydrogenase (short-subunit alcohol dehydrogenase family)